MNLQQLGSNTNYPQKPEDAILECFDNQHKDRIYLVPFIQERDEFTSLCPVTKQPDMARMEIIYVPEIKMIESKALKLYLFSFRNTGAFHEDVCNRITDDLFNVMKPKYLRVFGNFAPRGGIAIKPLVERWGTSEKETVENIKRLVDMWDSKK